MSGYLVRLDVEIPSAATNGSRPDGGPTGCLLLSPEEAEDLAHQLQACVRQAREFGKQ